MKVQISKPWNSSMLAYSLVGGVAFLATACAGDAGKIAGTFAPKTAVTQKLDTCKANKLSGSLKTFEKTPQKVCRKNSAGEAIDRDILPSFQMISKKGRIGIDHVVAFQLVYDDSVAAAKLTDEEKLTKESVVEQFLTSVCGPIVQSPFKKAGIAARFTFRPHRITDKKASSKTGIKGSSSSGDDLFFDGGMTARISAPDVAPEVIVNAAAVAPRTTQSAQQAQVRDVNLINSILGLTLSSEDSSISIQDDLSNLSSGSLKGGTPAPTEQQLQFCGQLLIRMAENVGLTEGRDCASLASAPDVESEVEPKVETKTEPASSAKTTTASAEAAGSDDAAIGAADGTKSADASEGTDGSVVASEKATAEKTVADKAPADKASVKTGTGLMKPGGHTVADLPNLKLADAEVLEIMKPVCGDLVTAKTPAAKTPAGKTP